MNEHVISEMTGRYILQVIVFGVLASICWIVTSRILRRSFDPQIPITEHSLWRVLLYGIGWGLLALALTILPALALDVYDSQHPEFEAYQHSILAISERTPKLIYGMFTVQSLYEELFFRGVVMALLGSLLFWAAQLAFMPKDKDMSGAAGQSWLARLWFWCGITAGMVTSLAFGIQHADNPGSTAFALLNIALAGMALGQVYWMHGSVLGAWSMHFVWNAGLATLGLPVSGWPLAVPLFGAGMYGAVPGILSGGAFGPEGSVFASASLLLVYLAMLRITWRSIRRLEDQAATAQLAATVGTAP